MGGNKPPGDVPISWRRRLPSDSPRSENSRPLQAPLRLPALEAGRMAAVQRRRRSSAGPALLVALISLGAWRFLPVTSLNLAKEPPLLLRASGRVLAAWRAVAVLTSSRDRTPAATAEVPPGRLDSSNASCRPRSPASSTRLVTATAGRSARRSLSPRSTTQPYRADEDGPQDRHGRAPYTSDDGR